MAAPLDITREIGQLRAVPGGNWLALALQKVQDHANQAAPAPPPTAPAPAPVTLESLLPAGTTLLTVKEQQAGVKSPGPLQPLTLQGGMPVVNLGSPANINSNGGLPTQPEPANTVLAGPTSGTTNVIPTFRALVAADLPANANETATAQGSNLLFGGPGSGAAALPTFRSLVAVDLPANANQAATAQSPNLIFAGPASGAAALPAFRAAVNADLPQTISVTAFEATPPNAAGFETFCPQTGTINPRFGFLSGSGGTSFGGLGYAAQAGAYASDAAAEDLVLRSDFGAVRLLHGNGGPTGFIVDASNNVGVLSSFYLTPLTAPPTGTPAVGTIAVDCTNNKLWVYCTTGWKGVALT